MHAKRMLDHWRDKDNNYAMDWGNAFIEAASDIRTIPGEDCSRHIFDIDDIVDVVASIHGEADEEDWLALVELEDGRFAFVSAGCAYSGWDAGRSGSVLVSWDKDKLISVGMSSEERLRMGLGAIKRKRPNTTNVNPDQGDETPRGWRIEDDDRGKWSPRR